MPTKNVKQNQVVCTAGAKLATWQKSSETTQPAGAVQSELFDPHIAPVQKMEILH